jgi:hypothetical protein
VFLCLTFRKGNFVGCEGYCGEMCVATEEYCSRHGFVLGEVRAVGEEIISPVETNCIQSEVRSEAEETADHLG